MCRLTRRHGFTLIELLIVVMILGIIASIVVANVGNSTRDSRHTTFATALRGFAKTLQLYHADTGDWPGAQEPGVIPPLNRFIDAAAFAHPTPMNGQWDLATELTGVQYAVGVTYANGDSVPSDEEFAKVDVQLDDGNLATGSFRKFGGGQFYFVLYNE